MSDAKWTPGPWRLAKAHEMHGVNVIAGKDDFVCEVGFPAPHSTVEADAHLIAAAPELEESHESLIDAVHLLIADKPVRDLDERLARASIVRAKARGQP